MTCRVCCPFSDNCWWEVNNAGLSGANWTEIKKSIWVKKQDRSCFEKSGHSVTSVGFGWFLRERKRCSHTHTHTDELPTGGTRTKTNDPWESQWGPAGRHRFLALIGAAAARLQTWHAFQCGSPPSHASPPRQTLGKRRVRPLHKSCCLHGQMHSSLKELIPTPQTLTLTPFCPQSTVQAHIDTHIHTPARRADAELHLNHMCVLTSAAMARWWKCYYLIKEYDMNYVSAVNFSHIFQFIIFTSVFQNINALSADLYIYAHWNLGGKSYLTESWLSVFIISSNENYSAV